MLETADMLSGRNLLYVPHLFSLLGMIVCIKSDITYLKSLESHTQNIINNK